LHKAQPLVSIITPLFNAAKWMEDFFQTVDAQTLTNFEVILVDDASPKEDFEIVRRMVEGRSNTFLYRLTENGGPAKARNLGIGKARGRFIAFLDADDLWLPEKLQRQTDFMQRDKVGFSFHDYRHMSPDGSMVGDRIAGPNKLDFRTHHVRRGTGGCLSVMIDRLIVTDFHFPDVDRALPEDYLAWLKIIKSGHVGVRLAEDLGRYRVSSQSRSGNKLSQALSVWRIYRHVEQLPFLTSALWWSQYSINSVVMYRGARPYVSISDPSISKKNAI
jgi:teichuronic acid biosynthesis glycosyltransferase TuaG